jgi:aspartate kinase
VPDAPPIVVQKYGGSSLSDVPRIQAVAERVVATARTGRRVVVVVSAMGNTTNELLALARRVSPNPRRRELDLLISVGERVSMTLLAMAIVDRGIEAASFTGSQSGIITDEQHVAAQVVEVRPHRVRAALDAGRVAIVAGFQGVSRAGEVTTLGRGGSDTTAVVLAAALQAESCEICSDVDGVWSADPRVVPAALRHEDLSLDAAAAMARAGSKVLLADALEHARRLGVRLDAASTARPPDSGTRLRPGPAPDAVVGVACDAELRALHLASPDLALPASLDGALRGWLPEGAGALALVDQRNLHDRDAIPLPPGARWGAPLAAVSAVGRSLVTTPAVFRRAVQAVAPCAPSHCFAAGETWTALVDPAAAGDAQRALHAALVEGGGDQRRR